MQKKKGVLIFSTPFDYKSADFLDKLGVSAFKIASVDLVNIPLIEHVAKKQKPLIISTGMSKVSEIKMSFAQVKDNFIKET